MLSGNKHRLLCDDLAIPPGVTAIVGGGGKSTLMQHLGRHLSLRGRVLLCTTTHFFPPDCPILLSPSGDDVAAAFRTCNLLAMGTLAQEGKLAPVLNLMEKLPELADYVLVEADGAKSLPLKAPAPHEPVIPKHTALVVAVAGMDGIGKTIEAAAHRPQLYAALLGKHVGEVITPRDVACILSSSKGQRKNVAGRFAVVLNKADDIQKLDLARGVAKNLKEEVFITALRTGPFTLESWRNGECLY